MTPEKAPCFTAVSHFPSESEEFMKRHLLHRPERASIPAAIILGASLILTGFPATPAAAAEPQSWQAGVASTIITPEEPLWMAGYAARQQPSQGTIHDLYVKALALRDPLGNRAVIVTADIIGYTLEFRRDVAETVSARFGLPPEALLLNASHTHCGPEVRPAKGEFVNMPPEYQDKVEPYARWLRDRFVETVGAALENLAPAEATFSTARPIPFAVSRRLPTEKGIVYRSTPSSYYTGGPRDDTVPVLRIAAPDGALRAVLFGYTCHPITLSIDYFCGDYPGYAQRAIEESHPGAVALFVQGCAGQLIPNARFQLEYAVGHGKALAEAVNKSLDGPQTPISGPLRCGYTETELRFQPLPERRVLEDIAREGASPGRERISSLISKQKAGWLLEQMDAGRPIPMTVPCPLQAVSFGKELILAGFGGEPVVDYAVALKEKNPGRFVWAAGYCNSMFGYVPSLQVLREGEYEGGRAFNGTAFPGPFAEDVEERVLGGMDTLIRRLSD